MKTFKPHASLACLLRASTSRMIVNYLFLEISRRFLGNCFPWLNLKWINLNSLNIRVHVATTLQPAFVAHTIANRAIWKSMWRKKFTRKRLKRARVCVLVWHGNAGCLKSCSISHHENRFSSETFMRDFSQHIADWKLIFYWLFVVCFSHFQLSARSKKSKKDEFSRILSIPSE